MQSTNNRSSSVPLASPLASPRPLSPCPPSQHTAVEEQGLFVSGNGNDDEDDEDEFNAELNRHFAGLRGLQQSTANPTSASTEAVVEDSGSKEAIHPAPRPSLEGFRMRSTTAALPPPAAMFPPLSSQTSLWPPASSGQGQKRGRPSQDTTTKKAKKASGNPEQSSTPSIKSDLSWYVEDHAAADMSSFTTFCNNVASYIRRPNSYAQPSHQELVTLREQLHQLPFYQGITNSFLTQSRILEDGLREIWEHPDDFPVDMIDFARELHWKWTNHRQSPNIYEGLTSQLGGSGTHFSRTWKANTDTSVRPTVSSAYRGSGHLFNGQWWPKNYLALRDGAHGSSMSGIHGSKANGAYSIVLSHFKENTQDLDEGDKISYCGQAGRSGETPSGTAFLLESQRGNSSIRVLRSANLPKSNQWRPERGIRYDGLYRIIGCEVVGTDPEQDGTNTNALPTDEPADEPAEVKTVEDVTDEGKSTKGKKGKKPEKDPKEIKRVSHRFILERLPGQSPLCPKNDVGARPTAQEIAAYDQADERNLSAFVQAKHQAKEDARPSQQSEVPFTEDSSPCQSPVAETVTLAEDIEQTFEAMAEAAAAASLEEFLRLNGGTRDDVEQ